jgi:hypothetical protein
MGISEAIVTTSHHIGGVAILMGEVIVDIILKVGHAI